MKYFKKSSAHFNRRLTAIGGQNGWLGVFLVDSIKNGLCSEKILLKKFSKKLNLKNQYFVICLNFLFKEILQFWEYDNDSLIAQVQFFTLKCVKDWSRIGL